MAKRRSELESFVLGLVWQTGPTSAYGIRRQLQASPSTQWSASAGAIYPLLQRLERAGLLKGRALKHGKRRRREYEITPLGLSELRAWIGPPLGDTAVSVAYDPLRSRARFLGALPAGDRAAWTDAAGAALDEVGRRVREWSETIEGEDPFLKLVTRQGELELQARAAWLTELKSLIRK
ncbi:MAG: PadR family transcriptional regulator [Phycisphaeraceae bacterium]|nr:PadR family transcriptional regulator [Phycisphaeraceae bacterium]